jgi:exodeoxyribonuclease V alpha subunit
MAMAHVILKEPLFDAFDRQLASLITRIDESEDENQKETVSLIAAMASRFSRDGHVCFDYDRAIEFWEETDIETPFPEQSSWLRAMENSMVVGRAGDYSPFIIDKQNRIYLYRYWKYQQIIADFIRRRVQTALLVDYPRLTDGLLIVFKDEAAKTSSGKRGNPQSVLAAWIAVTRGLCVISGGPGTGKTTTVAKILALLVEQSPDNNLRISLTAPTGKAAARLSDAVSAAKHRLNCAPGVINAVPEKALTIHRFLGSRPGSVYFRHHADNRVDADVVVVDEASMVDVALLAKLIFALPDECRLILVGDKDQLASVEAGSVFADICAAGQMDSFTSDFMNKFISAGFSTVAAGSSDGQTVDLGNKKQLDNSLIQLKKNYRFLADSGISRLSRAIRDGGHDKAISILADDTYQDVRWIIPEENFFEKTIDREVLAWFTAYMASVDASEAFCRFERFRILCALRKGPYGVRTVNAMIEERLKKEGLVKTDQLWYPGRPVMVTRNDYQRNLFNGDVGIALLDGQGRLRVYFSDGDGLRWFHPQRLPEHETIFAMTVHKSQGTEFSNVTVVLPEKDASVLTRELLYTAVTRATSSVTIAGSQKIIETAVGRKTFRVSGLVDELTAL